MLSHPAADLSGAIGGVLASVPQTMAYGLIVGAALGGAWSGVGVMAALWGSVVIGLGAALLGGCPVVVAGPRAATILVLAGLYTQLQALGLPTGGAVALGGMAVALAGLLQIGFGALKLGRLGSFIPFPVVAGFLNGSAILILLSQVWPASGLPRYPSLLDLFRHGAEIRPATLALSLGTALLILKGAKHFKKVPASLVGLVAGTLAYHLAAVLGFGEAMGGTMAALPDHADFTFVGAKALDQLDGRVIELLLPAAASMAVLSSLDALLTVSACDAATLRNSDGSRQLQAEGLANTLSGLFALMPGSGSMARTSAALRGGMRTALAPLLVAAMTAVVALALGPLIPVLPRAAMAGLLIAVAVELFDKWTIARLRQLARREPLEARGDLLAVAVVVAATVLLNLAAAVAVGLLVSLVAFATQMARSPIRRSYRASALIPRIHGDEARRMFIERHGTRIAILEVEGALFYGSAAPVEEAVEQLIADGVLHVVLDLKRVKDIDASGARALERIQAKLGKLGGLLAIGYVERERRRREPASEFDGPNRRDGGSRQPRRIWSKLSWLGAVAALGEERLLPDTDQAVALCERHLAGKLSEQEAVPTADGWAHTAVLRAFDRRMVKTLRAYMTMRDFAPGELIVAQGGPPDAVFFVAAGQVEVSIDLCGTDRKMRLQTMTRGAVFGEMAVIAPSPRSANIVALKRTRCYRLAADQFARLKREQPDIAFQLLANVAYVFAQRLRATNLMLAELEA